MRFRGHGEVTAQRGDSEVYRIYCRISRQAALQVGTAVASTAFADLPDEYTHEEFV